MLLENWSSTIKYHIFNNDIASLLLLIGTWYWGDPQLTPTLYVPCTLTPPIIYFMHSGLDSLSNLPPLWGLEIVKTICEFLEIILCDSNLDAILPCMPFKIFNIFYLLKLCELLIVVFKLFFFLSLDSEIVESFLSLLNFKVLTIYWANFLKCFFKLLFPNSNTS